MFGSPKEIFSFVLPIENKNDSLHLWLTITVSYNIYTTQVQNEIYPMKP